MKLLHDFFRLHLAGRRASAVRGGAAMPEFSVTVPAPLAAQVAEDAACATPDSRGSARREPASFLKSSRHHRRGAARG